MPVDQRTHQGYSACTEQKQSDFRYLVSYHTKVVKRMYERAAALGRPWPYPEYWYFDITAGSGRHPTTGDPGSPLIFAEEAERHGVHATMRLYDLEPSNCDSLRSELAATKLPCYVIAGDHNETLIPSIPEDPGRPRLGLLYCDTNGTYPPWPLLADFAKQKTTSRIDLLLYVAATTIKRLCGAHRDKGFMPLWDALLTIPKSDWLIRENAGRHQWTFILGTKWSKQQSFKNRDFWRIDSPEGEELLRRLTDARGCSYGDPSCISDLRRIPAPSLFSPRANSSHAPEQRVVRGVPEAAADRGPSLTLPGLGDIRHGR